MKLWFSRREYPEDLINSEMSKVKFSNLRLKSNDNNHNRKEILLFVTYHPLLKSLSAIKQCQVCNNITEADSFTCSNDQTNFKINHRFDCNEKCLIYLITCNRCLKQYLGQTVDEFRQRWNNYKDNARKFERGEQFMQRHFFV